MRLLAVAAVSALVGCGVALTVPELASSVRASSPPAGAVCVCREDRMPSWVGWADSHQAWRCTVILPRDQSVLAQPCAYVSTQPPLPVGFDVRLTP